MDDLDRAKEVLQRAYVISLGTHDEQGVWVADLLYVMNENCEIYWMSDPSARHSRAIERDGRVAAAVTASVAGEKDLGLQIQGFAERLGSLVAPSIISKFLARMRFVRTAIALGQVSERYEWYILRPAIMELIDQERYGFERRRLLLPISSRGASGRVP